VSEPESAWEGRVAVLIVVVTMLGSVVAFLQIQAGNREAKADRQAQAAAVGSMSSVGEANRLFTRQTVIQDLYGDLNLLRDQLSLEPGGGAAGRYAGALARAYASSAEQIAAYANPLLGGQYVTGGGGFDLVRFFEDGLERGYRDAELEKAYARARDGWGAKGMRYLTAITAFAFAVFLLGMGLTVPDRARQVFVWAGCAFAFVTATASGVVWVLPVEEPQAAAIDAYVEGQATVDVADFFITDVAARRRALVLARRDFTRALDARPNYQEAQLARGSSIFFLDLTDPSGPRGSEAARTDLTRAVRLDPDDFIAWANLGATLFWLGDYRGALSATDQALSRVPNDVIAAMNRALFLLATQRDTEYGAQLARVGTALLGASTWLRTLAMDRYADVIHVGLRHRPELGDELRTLRHDLREIDASIRTHRATRPRDVGATMAQPVFVGGRGRLVARVAYRGVPTGSRWLYDTYVDGKRAPALSYGPKGWQFPTRDGGFDVTFTNLGSFVREGSVLRIEVFLEGKLMTAGEHRVVRSDLAGP
jgi:tetratricopeptide (TPR) repeat protein